MANVFNKVERMVRTALALLERDTVLGQLVWRDAAGDFRGAKDDTISIRLPAYSKASKRALRSGDTRTATTLHERKVDVTLTDDLFTRIVVTDEELTLDIESFEAQIVVPVIGGLVRGIEDEIVAEVQGATYQNAIGLDEFDKPHKAFARARRLLNEARVPMDGRSLIVGSEIEEILLTDDLFVKANESGSTEALRSANIGRIYGMPVFSVPALKPDEAYAFHRTAYVLNSRAPLVPAGAPSGRSLTQNGFALRLVQVLDPDTVDDNLHADVWTGTGHVKDAGSVDAEGRFEPAVDPTESGAEELFVRAVKINTVASS